MEVDLMQEHVRSRITKVGSRAGPINQIDPRESCSCVHGASQFDVVAVELPRINYRAKHNMDTSQSDR